MPKFYWNLKGGTKGNISKFNSIQGFSRLKSKYPLVPPLRFSLKFLKKSRVNFTLVPPLRFFPKKIFPGGATPPSGQHCANSILIFSLKIWWKKVFNQTLNWSVESILSLIAFQKVSVQLYLNSWSGDRNNVLMKMGYILNKLIWIYMF